MTTMKPTVAIIVAALRSNGGIGINGKMPWRLRKEIKYFKEVTSRTTDANNINAVLMGRKTWESIPKKFRPLPNRINIVLSRSHENKVSETDENVIFANSISESLRQIPPSKRIERVFVIGGAEIYNELINDDSVEYLLITDVEHSDESSLEIDTFLRFPMYTGEKHSWEKQSKEALQEFVGKEIEIEDDIQEGDFKYNYTLWKKNVD